MANTLKFAVFADAHYRKDMYATTVDDLNKIFDRANEKDVDFVMHLGDFCNYYVHSPEFTNAYLNNKYNLPVYGIYGNHELEGDGFMQYVTPRLTNDRSVIWGTEDGKIGDGSVDYYYFEKNGIRIVCTSTAYSFCPTTNEWEHNRPGSWDCHAGNSSWGALGPVQLEWLRNTLIDATNKGIPCIVTSHHGFATLPGWYADGPSADRNKVLEIFKEVNTIRPKTVIMAINGHYHTNHIGMQDNILFFDVNTVNNGYWMPAKDEHYEDKHTYSYTEFNCYGEPIKKTEKAYNTLIMGQNTYFFQDPLSAIVTVDGNGEFEIEGMETKWAHDIIPSVNKDGKMTRISSGKFKLD